MTIAMRMRQLLSRFMAILSGVAAW
jgi:hypothetical protein